jgi:hypothetical protein
MAGNWPEAQVRKTFFDFFEQRGHTLGELPTGTKKKKYGCRYRQVRPSKWRG